MSRFKHDEDELSTALGFDTERDLLASAISGLLAAKADSELTEDERIAVIHFMIGIYPDTECVLFDSQSQLVEALYNCDPINITAALDAIVDADKTDEFVDVLTERYNSI